MSLFVEFFWEGYNVVVVCIGLKVVLLLEFVGKFFFFMCCGVVVDLELLLEYEEYYF